MSGFCVVEDPSFVAREFDPSSDDEIVAYGERAGDVPFGFHCVGSYEARQLAACDWLDDEIRHEHVEDGDEDDLGDVDLNDEIELEDSEPTDYDDIEVVERMVVVHRRIRKNHPNRSQIRVKVYDWIGRVISSYIVGAQHRHGGNDTRRRRHGDGKLLGNRNVHREDNCSGYAPEFVPTEVFIDGADHNNDRLVFAVRIK